jgi:hypothetical protein
MIEHHNASNAYYDALITRLPAEPVLKCLKHASIFRESWSRRLETVQVMGRNAQGYYVEGRKLYFKSRPIARKDMVCRVVVSSKHRAKWAWEKRRDEVGSAASFDIRLLQTQAPDDISRNHSPPTSSSTSLATTTPPSAAERLRLKTLSVAAKHTQLEVQNTKITIRASVVSVESPGVNCKRRFWPDGLVQTTVTLSDHPLVNLAKSGDQVALYAVALRGPAINEAREATIRVFSLW